MHARFLVWLLVIAVVPQAHAQQEPGGSEQAPETEGPVEQEEQKSQWAPSASALLGQYETEAIAPLVEEAFGLDVDLRGRSWDVGVARGRPGHSYFRLAYTEVQVEDGSSVLEGPTSIGGAVRTRRSIARGVRIRGAKIERIWRMGPVSWAVAPMLTTHIGVGKIAGQVIQTTTETLFNPALGTSEERTTVRTKGARELLEREWLPILGIGLGLTGQIGDYVTITASVIGVEFPGIYKGSIQVVYWPRRSR